MRKISTSPSEKPVVPEEISVLRDPITKIVRLGASRILEQALKQEIDEYLARFNGLRDKDNHKLVVRNGYLPPRNVLTGIGDVPVQQPRVRDKRVKFESKILPPYLRKTKNIEDFLPWLYLKGISTGDMEPTHPGLIRRQRQGAFRCRGIKA